jgi:hypothetical protein
MHPNPSPLKKLRGPQFRYYGNDPGNDGRGPGYYRVYRGQYFKKRDAAS